MGCSIKFKPKGKAIASSILRGQVEDIIEKYPHLVLDMYNESVEEDGELTLEEVTQDVKDSVAMELLSHFRTPYFTRNFGEWETEEANIAEDKLNEKGEPLLSIDNNNGKYFYKNKFNEKIYFPSNQNGLSAIPGFTNERINKAVKVLGKRFFQTNFNLDYNDLSFLAQDDFETEIKNILEQKIEEELALDPESVTAYDLQQSLPYVNEWAELVQTYFKSIGFKVADVKSENQEEEQGGSEQLIKQASYSQDSKDKISANIKVLLSIIEDAGNDNIDYIFEETPFVEFNDIYNTILHAVHSTTVIEEAEGKIVDAYDTMISTITELADSKPYLHNLLDILNDPNYSTNRKTEFFQAFYLTKNNFFVSEIEVGKNGIKHVVKNVSDSSQQFNTIKNNWYENFKDITGVTDGKVDFKIVKEAVADLSESLVNFKARKQSGTTVVTNSEILINDLLNVLNSVGVDLDIRAIETEYKKALATNSPGVIISDVTRIRKALEDVAEYKVKIKEDNPFETQSVFSNLAKKQAFFAPSSGDNSIQSAGKSYWGYSYPSHIQNEVNKWKSVNGKFELNKAVTGIRGNESSVLLKHLTAADTKNTNAKDKLSQKRLNSFKLGIFNVLQDKKTERKKSDPKDNTSLAKNDALANSVNLALRITKGSENTSLFYTPTPADKVTAFMMEHDLFFESKLSVKDGGFRFSDQVLDVYYNYFRSEYSRMIQAHKELTDDSVQKIMHYHSRGPIYKDGKLTGNAFKSQLFPTLSHENIHKGNLLYNADGSPALTVEELDARQAGLKTYINTALETKLKETRDKLIKAGILNIKTNREGQTFLANKGIDHAIFYGYVEAQPSNHNLYKMQTYNLIADYFVNSSINLIEYSKMFSGDPAYYKDMVDYSKRIPATYTDGLGLRIENKDEQFFNAAVIAGVEVPSPYLKELEETVGSKIAQMYSKNNTTDAQAWITPKRWEFLVRKTGLWTDTHDTAYQKILGNDKTPFTEKEKKAVAQPLKGVYFSRDTTNIENGGRPTYLKYSQAVLIPGLIQGSPLEKMYDQMVEKDISETITIDGVKAGAIDPVTIHDETGGLLEEFELNSYKLDNRGWKLQQNLPTKTTKDTDVGSQIQKNALMGVAQLLEDTAFNLKGNDVSGQSIYDGLNEIIGELSNKGVSEIKKELGINDLNQIENIDGLYNLLLKDAKSKGIENQNLIRAIEKNISIYGIPGSKEKLLNMFFSIVKDRAIKVKTNGGSVIQVSNFGLDRKTAQAKTGIKWFIDPETGLKPPLTKDVEVEVKDPETGEITTKTVKRVQPGQVLLPGSIISKYIPNWQEIDAKELEKMIDPEILNSVIGYRIPNQGLSSNDSLEIVGFLPEGMGDAVVAYSEIPTKTGSDFDIDKMFMMYPSFYPRYDFSKSDIKHIRDVFRKETIAKTIEFLQNTVNTLEDNELDYELDELSEALSGATSDAKIKVLGKTTGKLLRALKNSKNPKAKELVKALDLDFDKVSLKYVHPKKDKEGNVLPREEQSKEALQNDLIQHYKAIFTHPEVIKDVLMPIDFDFIKDHIVSMFPAHEGSDLDNFDIMNQIDTKYLFISGKAGVGLTANALVDYVRGMFYDSTISNFNVNGNLKNGNTKFDEEYSQSLTDGEAKLFLKQLYDSNEEFKTKGKYDLEGIKQMKISHSLSAFLNAYVDIAKDPYVTRGNWTTQTSNVGFLLLRAGVHPFKVNAFMAQPVIKTYIDETINTESKIGQDVGDVKVATLKKHFKVQAMDNFVEVTKNGKDIKYNYYELFDAMSKGVDKDARELILLGKGLSKEQATKVEQALGQEKKFIGLIRDPKALAGLRKNSKKSFNSVEGLLEFHNTKEGEYNNSAFQLDVLFDFFDLLDKAKKMNNLAKSAKPDVNGPGKNLTTLLITDNLKQELLSKSGMEYEFDNIADRYEKDGKNTMLGHYHKNGIDFTKSVVEANPTLFFTGSEKVSAVFNDISNMIYGEPLNKENLGDILNGEFYSYMMTGFRPLTERNFLTEGKEQLIEQIEQFKDNVKDNAQYEGNFLLDNLQVVSEVATEGFGKMQKEVVTKYLVMNRALKGDDVSNKLYASWSDLMVTAPDIANGLIKYSFYQSGFNMNRTQFFTSIPHEFFIESNFNDHMRNMAKQGVAFSDFSDQFFRHNWKNDVIVPHFTFNNKNISSFGKDLGGGVLLANSSKTKKLKPFIKVGDLNLLAKLQGINANGQGVYLYTHKLGNSNNYGNFTEYDFDMSPKNSIFADNKPASELLTKGQEYIKLNPVAKTAEEYFMVTEKENTSGTSMPPMLAPGTQMDLFGLDITADDLGNSIEDNDIDCKGNSKQ